MEGKEEAFTGAEGETQEMDRWVWVEVDAQEGDDLARQKWDEARISDLTES